MTEVDKMKLTKVGCFLNLQPFSCFLSVFGIVFSIIGTIGGYTAFVIGFLISYRSVVYNLIGVFLIALSMPYLAMWILFKIKTSKQDIPGIERLGKVYIYVSGSIEIIGMVVYIGFFIADIVYYASRSWGRNPYLDMEIGQIVCASVYLLFACLKILLIRVEKNKLLGKYLAFRYALFVVYLSCLFMFNTYLREHLKILSIIGLFGGIPYLVLDMGLMIILHSIRVDRKKTAGIENPLNNI